MSKDNYNKYNYEKSDYLKDFNGSDVHHPSPSNSPTLGNSKDNGDNNQNSLFYENNKETGSLYKKIKKNIFSLRGFLLLFSNVFEFCLLGFFLIPVVVFYYLPKLPSVGLVLDYQPSIKSVVYDRNNDFVTEYVRQTRTYLPYGQIPEKMIMSLLSVEDRNFYNHKGFDPIGILRAFTSNLKAYMGFGNIQGASTLTQQLARNIFLSHERTYDRKIKEFLLSLRIEDLLSKEKILEYYMNEIYLGRGVYGFSAAANVYFGKNLRELKDQEYAFLAGLPKSPATYDKVKSAAIARRNVALEIMADQGVINQESLGKLKATDLVWTPYSKNITNKRDYYNEEVRLLVGEKYGDNSVYTDGFKIKTGLDTKANSIAQKILKSNIERIDNDLGWHGVITNISSSADPFMELRSYYDDNKDTTLLGTDGWSLVYVIDIVEGQLKVMDTEGNILTADNSILKNISISTRQDYQTDKGKNQVKIISKKVTSFDQFLAVGDVILIEEKNTGFVLREIPEIQGALVVIDAKTGDVLALAGGWSVHQSMFNRATQAMRQPGSAIKPFVYAVGLDNGYTPANIFLDAPIRINSTRADERDWVPANDGNVFYGPTTLRRALEFSRNLITIRLTRELGTDKIASKLKELNLGKNHTSGLSLSLGVTETTLLNIVNAYRVFINGGKYEPPKIIKEIRDRQNNVIYPKTKRVCGGIEVKERDVLNLLNEDCIDIAEDSGYQVFDERTSFQIRDILEGVVKRGSGRRAKTLPFVIAGKTGTSDTNRDTWFVGFNEDIIVGAYVGYDSPKSLGDRSYGANTSLPIVVEFFNKYYEGKEFPKNIKVIPDGLNAISIDYTKGTLPTSSTQAVITEFFKEGSESIVERQEDEHEESDDVFQVKGSFGRIDEEGFY